MTIAYRNRKSFNQKQKIRITQTDSAFLCQHYRILYKKKETIFAIIVISVKYLNLYLLYKYSSNAIFINSLSILSTVMNIFKKKKKTLFKKQPTVFFNKNHFYIKEKKKKEALQYKDIYNLLNFYFTTLSK